MPDISRFSTGSNPPERFRQQDPDSYANDYARKNGISTSEAQESLRTQFGDPIQEQGIQGGNSIFDQANGVKTNDYNNFEFEGMQDEDPNEFAQLYADANNMTLDEAMEELEGLYGAPDEQQDSSNSYSALPDTDPETYAQQYANKNGITLDEAKEILESKYGAPQDREDSSSNYTLEYSQNFSTSSSSIPSQIDPDTYAQQYANENGITLDEAKEILASMYGTPEEQ